jgi:hypothetical protein
MSKILMVHPKALNSFGSPWMNAVVGRYIDFEPWNANKTYPLGTLCYFDCFDAVNHADLVAQMTDRGFKIVIDNLWEAVPDVEDLGALRLSCDAWFWYNESVWYRYWGYDAFQPQPDHEFLALMPMRMQKPFRTDFLNTIAQDLDRMMWSYVAQNRQLPEDGDISNWSAQRYMNPMWYNKCYMSMVVETAITPYSNRTPTFITEKTFKPLAFRHPFLVYGNSGTLRKLHDWGFVTFDNLWDESYDRINNWGYRRDRVAKLLHETEIQPHSNETLQRLEHNHQHFFNAELVQQRIVAEIVEPLIQYAETR